MAAETCEEIDTALELWIARKLVSGIEPDSLAEALFGRGYSADELHRTISHIQSNPAFQVAKSLQQQVWKRDWLFDIYSSLAIADVRTYVVPQLDRPSADVFFTGYYAINRPAILKHLVDHWEAPGRWTAATLAEKIPEPEVEVQARRPGGFEGELDWERYRQSMPVSAFLARMTDPRPSNDIYLTSKNNRRNRVALTGLRAGFGDIPGYLAGRNADEEAIWLGPAGTITPLHHDLTNNLLVQVIGRKRVTLVPSWELPRIAPRAHFYSAFSDPGELRMLPLEQRPTMIDCVIGPGDTLFIPVGWYHHVEALEASLSVSFIELAWPNNFVATSRHTMAAGT